MTMTSMRGRSLFVVLITWSLPANVASFAAETASVGGTVPFDMRYDEAKVPERFRLPSSGFTYREQSLGQISKSMSLSLVTFPSPVETEHERNNTVHCEYYRPTREGRVPGVVVLHILGGDFPLARVFANSLAQRGVAALFLKMPYYGPRRDYSSPRRMVTSDPHETVEGMTQAIQDIRRATMWMSARDEIDADNLGVFGISLGGITGALAVTVEPRLTNACLLLAGGDIAQVAWQSPELADVRNFWIAKGGSRKEFFEVMRKIDPVTYANPQRLRGARILMLNAAEDEVVPKACTLSLWKALGEPEIVWYSGGHYTAAGNIFNALDRVPRFFVDR